MQALAPKPYFSYPFSMLALYSLAMSVSLGVALVSISKLLIVLAVLAKLISLWRAKKLKWIKSGYVSFSAIAFGLVWLYLSLLWSEGGDNERMVSFMRHARLWVIPAVYFLIDSKRDALKVLLAVILGQIFVILSSWLLWLGMPLPWAITAYPISAGVVFASTLEQPVMSTLMLVLVWFLRAEIPLQWRTKIVTTVLVFTISNVFFVMTGRTGYLVMLLAISLAIFWLLPKKWRPAVVFFPLLMALVLGLTSTRFQTKMAEIERDVVKYQNGKVDDSNSQGLRLDYWAKSLEAIQDKPLLGHGVGSWRVNYMRLGGADKVNPPSNPHQQFLLWAVEGGLIGLALLLAIFASLYRDAGRLQTPAQQALKATLAISFLMSMMNCPFFGAGMGEFFFVMMGALLATKDRQLTQP
jgi:O-antigen ligase